MDIFLENVEPLGILAKSFFHIPYSQLGDIPVHNLKKKPKIVVFRGIFEHIK